MSTIFLSYRRSDSQDITQLIHAWLIGRYPQDTFFLDITSIDPGKDFRAAIEEAIIGSQLVFVIIGQKWRENEFGVNMAENPSDSVRFEVEMAIRHNKPVIPLLVNSARMPTAQELPATLTNFSYTNAMVITSQTFSQDMEAVGKVKEHFAPAPQPHTSALPTHITDTSAAFILLACIFTALFPLVPLATFFMARSQAMSLKGVPGIGTARTMVRIGMGITLASLIIQGLFVMGAIVLNLLQVFLPR